MEDNIYIARTEKEYKEGLKNPSKNIMYFPNANQMTMKGMKTPIKYYGITDGMITDEGYARPGQKFNVNGISTLEVRMPQMKYGGRAKYQFGGGTPTGKVDDLITRLITAVQKNPENIQSYIAEFRSLIPNHSVEELDRGVQLILDNAQVFPNESYKVFLNEINLANNPQTREDRRVGSTVSRLVDRINNKPGDLKDAIAEFKNTIKTFHPSNLQTLGPQIAKIFEGLPEVRDEILKAGNFDLKDYSYKPEFQKSLESYPSRSNWPEEIFPEGDPRKLLFQDSPILDTTPIDEKGFPGKQTIRENMGDLNDFRGPSSTYNPQDHRNRAFISINNPNDPETYDYYKISNDPNNPIGRKIDKDESYDIFGEIGSVSSDDPNYFYYPTPVYLRDKYGLEKAYSTREVNEGLTDVEEKLVGPDKPFKTKEAFRNYVKEYKKEASYHDDSYFFRYLNRDLINPDFKYTYNKPRGSASPGYTIPDWIGAGKDYESVEDYQRAIKEFAKETNTPYTLTGPNEGMDNVYGYSSDLFLKDPARKAAFEKWKASKKPATVTTTPATTTTTVTGNTATTTNPNEVKTEPKKDVTVDGDKKVRYTDPNSVESIYLDENRYPNRWVQTPMGYVKLNDGYNHLTKGSQVSYNTNYPSNTRSTGYLAEVDDDDLERRKIIEKFYNDAKRTYPSVKISEKLKGAYDKLDQGFDNFTNMIYSDRSDRIARRAEKLLSRAEAAEAIGQDRRAGRLYRKADRQIAKIEPLERIQEANEARRDAQAQIGLNKIDYRLGVKENRANERRISAEAEAMMSSQYYQNLKANKQNIQSSKAADDREKVEGRYSRAKEDAGREIEKNIIEADSREFRTGLKEKYKGIKNQYNEENKNQRTIDLFEDRDRRAGKRYDTKIKKLNQEQLNRIEPERLNTIRKENEQPFYDGNDELLPEYKLGGQLIKFADSGLFNGGDPIPNNYPKWTPPKYEFPAWTPKEKPEPIKMPMIDASKDFSNWAKDRDDKFFNYYFDINNPAKVVEGVDFTDPKNRKNPKGTGMGFYGHTPGEFTQFAGTMMPAFYNLAQSMRKPHKFKEFQNPYAGRFLSNLASQYLPYDDSKIVAQQNRVMRNAQQQAPNFQVAQAYQMAGMDSLNRQLKDYQMKNFMGNQELAKQYNQASYGVAGEQQAIKAQAYENDRKTQAALNQMQHKAVTQFGVGIHDLGKLMVNREMNAMDWALMSQVYQQYGLAPFEAVMSGQASYDDIVRFNKNPVAMQELIRRTEKAKAENAAAKQTQQTTTENYDNSGINASSTTTTTPRAGAAGGGAGTKKTGGKLFNLNVIKKY